MASSSHILRPGSAPPSLSTFRTYPLAIHNQTQQSLTNSKHVDTQALEPASQIETHNSPALSPLAFLPVNLRSAVFQDEASGSEEEMSSRPPDLGWSTRHKSDGHKSMAVPNAFVDAQQPLEPLELGDFFYAAGNPCSWFVSPASSMTSTVLTEEEEQVISDAEDEARVEELIRPGDDEEEEEGKVSGEGGMLARELSPEPHTLDRGDRTWLGTVLINEVDELHDDAMASLTTSPPTYCARCTDIGPQTSTEPHTMDRGGRAWFEVVMS
ncbi:uncharacterized protein STEHIDRAFT_173193 [Stereum hirsutum FP-91666 SS1]|uniref:Uncharacterized protein n=1 Tax=Stereum hirsutum (strain FP-91666) TaxID=721885 RepID=R7RVU4_STEHR|nr:uncharacterized protein STEHIDRAFT_173193 [Stereum hirsutum FP-91666 SS1]EIM79336.1 hypothetical protein STEHIDRAFT_173193 [Stereum hirsutum FP-91666 SS1]